MADNMDNKSLLFSFGSINFLSNFLYPRVFNLMLQGPVPWSSLMSPVLPPCSFN